MLKRKKTDLFGLWIDFNEDWDRVAAEVERTRETSNLSRKEWEAVQAKTLKSQMSQEKFDDLVKKRKESGLYYQDDDYPNDELDRGSSKNDCFRSCLCFKWVSMYSFLPHTSHRFNLWPPGNVVLHAQGAAFEAG